MHDVCNPRRPRHRGSVKLNARTGRDRDYCIPTYARTSNLTIRAFISPGISREPASADRTDKWLDWVSANRISAIFLRAFPPLSRSRQNT